MEIKEDKRIVTGKHKGAEFHLEDGGLLNAYGTQWSVGRVKTLVELVTLLQVSGYSIQKKNPKFIETQVDSLFGPHIIKVQSEDTEAEANSEQDEGR